MIWTNTTSDSPRSLPCVVEGWAHTRPTVGRQIIRLIGVQTAGLSHLGPVD